MNIKQYKNTLGIYEPYQSGGGNARSESYYSTPDYMSFMDAMYVNKYGKINQSGGFDLSNNLHHYFRTLRNWSQKLSNEGVHNGGMVVNDGNAHKKAEKALNMHFNVYSANKAGGRNKLLIKRGGAGDEEGHQPNRDFALLFKGDGTFKPVLYSKLEKHKKNSIFDGA